MSAQSLRFPIGISDFRKLREGAYHYVDKSALIEEVLGAGAEVILLPRPRRFGKTLNLSMLRYFLEKSPEGWPKAG
jgi:Predicted AAA-ATPase